jgi:hypothetical protein
VSKNVVDANWVNEQFASANVDEHVQEVVLALLENGWDGLNVDEDKLQDIFDTFITLAQGHALLKNETEESWIPVERGFVHRGDVVRVRHDAFDGKAGQYHNGRVGKVVAVRSGDIVFRSTDDGTPLIDGARYSPDKLQRRVV